MKCPSCKAPLEADARFCGVCGNRIGTAERPVTGDSQPRQPSVVVDESVTTDQDDDYVGTVLNNRFAIESKLGEGGFGAVYRGTQLLTGRKVAIKLLHPGMTQDENLVARFRREGLVLCNLRDAHTVTTYDFDQTPDGTLYIAMELLEGKSLHDVYYAEAPLDWRRVLKVVTEMCSSLAEAHGQGIVHRDLKPENIYLENRPGNPEFVKILDFGIAKVIQGDGHTTQAPQLTATGQTLGTLEYMSPEQLMGKQLDGRSDIYAMGVLAYEMMCGRLPFPDAKGPAQLITAQLRKVPESPSKSNPQAGIPPEVDRIVLTMLEKERDKRFADVNQLRHACTEALKLAEQRTSEQPRTGSVPGMGVDSSVDARAGSAPGVTRGLSGGLGGGPGGPRGGSDSGVDASAAGARVSTAPGTAPGMPPGQPPFAPPGMAAPPTPVDMPGALPGSVPASAAPHARRESLSEAMTQVQQVHVPTAAVHTASPASGSRLWLWVTVGIAAVSALIGAALAL